MAGRLGRYPKVLPVVLLPWVLGYIFDKFANAVGAFSTDKLGLILFLPHGGGDC